MTPGSLIGINELALRNTALAYVGNQKVKYLQDLIAEIGSTPKFQLVYKNPVLPEMQVFYEGTVSTALSIANDKISITAIGSVTTNTANTLSEPVRVRLLKTDGTKYIEFPVSLTDGSISQATDGTKTVTPTITINAPPELIGTVVQPPPADDGPYMDINTAMNNQKLVSQLPIFNDGSSGAATVCCPHYQGIVGICDWNPSAGITFDERWNSMTVWCWFYRAPGDTALQAGKRVKIRKLKYAYLSNTSGTWEHFPVKRFTVNDYQFWNGRREQLTPAEAAALDADVRTESDGDLSVRITDNIGAECWPQGFKLINSRTKITDMIAFAAICEARIINADGTDYNGSDAKMSIRLGYDPYADGSEFLDGGACSWRYQTGDEGWKSIGVLNIDEDYKHDFPHPPFGDYNPPAWPYNRSPFVRTEAQIRALAPNWITF